MWKPMLAFVLAIPGYAQQCCAQQPLVKGVGNFIHNVANLDESVHFYKDLIGMEVPRPPGDWQTTEGVLKMYGAVGGKFRVANAQVTGVAMRVEMVEFSGVDRKPVRRAIGEPGASLLILTAADLQPVLERLKAANWPLAVETTQGCGRRGFAVADPDGFPVVILQGDPGGATGRNITGLSFGYTVSDDAVAKTAFKALHLAGEPVSQCGIDNILKTSVHTDVKLPDGFVVTLAQARPGKKSSGTLRPRDPGAAVLRLAVNDAEAAVKALNEAGIKVVSEGGAIQTLPPAGLKATILGAPDNLFIQVVQ